MPSELHNQLQERARNYLLNKGYWIVGVEVPMPLGVCDAWGMSNSNNYETMAIEVKVSRGDFRSNSQKYKENSISQLGNYQYILCPENMIRPEEVHSEWGLLWWNGKKIINKKKAPRLEMIERDKIATIMSFLENRVNNNRPKL